MAHTDKQGRRRDHRKESPAARRQTRRAFRRQQEAALGRGQFDDLRLSGPPGTQGRLTH